MNTYPLTLLLLGFLIGAASGVLAFSWLGRRAGNNSLEIVDHVHLLLLGLALAACVALGVLVLA